MENIIDLIEKGKDYIEKEDYRLAEDIFCEILKIDSNNEQAHFELGKAYYLQERYSLAIEELKNAIVLNRNNGFAFLLLGKCYKTAKEYEKASEMFKETIELGYQDENIQKELNEVKMILERNLASKVRNGFEITTKGFRRNIPPFRACATWLITNKCNYRCSYCQDSHEDSPGFKILTSEEWFSIWRNLYNKFGTMAIQVTGGEPTAYPNFFEILKYLSKMHNFDIQTNMSWEPKELIEKVPPERISRIGGSFHSEHTEFEPFLKKIIALKEAGYRTEINYVAYPPFLKKTREYHDIAKNREVQFSIISFQGEYSGKKYPENYNNEEKEILRGFNVSSGESALAMAEWDKENKTVGERKEAPSPLRKCRMGQMYTWIKSNGEAMRCCKSKQVLGNIIEGTFNLLDEVLLCNIEDCICWRNMAIGEEERWIDRWPGTKE